MNERFTFISVPRRRNPVVIAYNALEVDGKIEISYGASFCNNSDRFDRARGREIAAGRLQYRPICLQVPFPDGKSFSAVVNDCIRSNVTANHMKISQTYSPRLRDAKLEV